MMTSRSARFYLPPLDGLRFLAFFLVFVHHAPPIPSQSQSGALATVVNTIQLFGWVGVELFFVLSAFLMTSLLLRESVADGSISVSKFFVRRILRIWPLYFFGLIIGFVVIPIVWSPPLTSPEYREMARTYLLPYLMFFGNVPIAIFGLPQGHSGYMLGLLWTISFEEQFYLVLPFLLTVLAKETTRSWFTVLLGLFLLGVAVRVSLQLMSVPSHPAIWVLPIARPDSFLVGMLIAVVNERASPEHRFSAKLGVPLLLLALLLLSAVSQGPMIGSESWHKTWQYTAVSIGMGTIVMVVVSQPSSVLGRFLGIRPLTYLGKISYGLYVYHVVVLHVVHRIIEVSVGLTPSTTWMRVGESFAALLATVAISAISYRWLERPFLRWKEGYALIRSRPV